MTNLTTYPELEQGTPEWLEARRGIVTASVVGKLIAASRPSGVEFTCPECGALPGGPCVSLARKEPTPIKTLHSVRVAPDDAPDILDPADGDTARGLIRLLAAERITGHVEPTFQSDAMFRGRMDEPLARDLYSRLHAPAREFGFMVRDLGAARLGYSPDGLVGGDGLIEVKSAEPKIQLARILGAPIDHGHMAQMQAGMYVSGRAWCDYVSYCGGMPMWVQRVEADQRWFDAIVAAVTAADDAIAHMVATYEQAVEGLPTTERIDYFAEASI